MNKDRCLWLDGITKWKRCGRLTADRICLEVRKREHVLIWGNAGEGVRELMEIALGCRKPEEGTVILTGRAAVIPEDFPALEGMNVERYLCLPLMLKGNSEREAWEESKKVLQNSILWEKRSTKAEFLSGYEQCILMLLMAVSCKPDMLFVGNCLKNLNEREKEKFCLELKKFTDMKKTALVCFSDREDIPYPFERKYRIQDGRLSQETGE